MKEIGEKRERERKLDEEFERRLKSIDLEEDDKDLRRNRQ